MSLKLPADFVADYGALLRSVASELTDDREYCAFAARCGNAYAPGGLMFYGRATNGWTRDSSFTCATLEQPTRLADTILSGSQEPICSPYGEAGPPGPYLMLKDESCDGDPMHWLKHRRKNITENRSQYWQCAKEVASRHLHLDEATWHRHIAWSNLYKIGPQQPIGSTQAAGNPSTKLQKVQRPGCARIVEREVAHFRPSCIVFLTETNEDRGYIDDFVEHLTLRTVKPNAGLKYVRATGKLHAFGNDYNVVLAQHPQGRPPLAVAEDVLRAVSSL